MTDAKHTPGPLREIELERQRDELRAALREVLCLVRPESADGLSIAKARAALARCQ